MVGTLTSVRAGLVTKQPGTIVLGERRPRTADREKLDGTGEAGWWPTMTQLSVVTDDGVSAERTTAESVLRDAADMFASYLQQRLAEVPKEDPLLAGVRDLADQYRDLADSTALASRG